MRDGATVVDPATTWIDATVTVGTDTVIRPHTQIHGASTIGADCVIGPDTTLEDVEVGDGATIVRTQALLAVIGPGANVGPFSYLRPGTELGAKGKIGGFVETKNAQIAAGAKVPHLTYAGDVTIGEKANIGAGTIFANYDGVRKHHSSVGAGTFVGSNSVIVAPVHIAGNAYVAAGSAITDDVKDGDLAIARERQRNIEGWVERRQAKDREHDGADHVTGIMKTTQKNLMVFSGRAHPELADQVAAELGTDLVPTSAYDFANGEIYVRYEESVRGSDAFVIQSHTAPINQWIMEQLIMVDALKRASAKRITVVLPFYGYARQDKKHRGREPISARLMADLFKQAGADRLMAVDLHTAQIQGFFDGPVDHLMALPILADYVAERYGDQQLAVVSPDAGRIRVAEQWSERLGGAPLAFIHKTRDINRPNESVANRVVGAVEGRICVLVDDMIDTGSTITKAADALFGAGAAGVVIAATHAILSGPAVDRLKNCSAAEVIVTDTLPIPADRMFDKLTVLSIAPLISKAIREVFEDGSVTSLFDGRA